MSDEAHGLDYTRADLVKQVKLCQQVGMSRERWIDILLKEADTSSDRAALERIWDENG